MLQQCLPLAVLKLYYLQMYQRMIGMLQQCLPLAVLKPIFEWWNNTQILKCCNSAYRLRYWNTTGIIVASNFNAVATVLTACGIETLLWTHLRTWSTCPLQQCLPLAVLKPFSIGVIGRVIKPSCNSAYRLRYWNNRKLLLGGESYERLQQCLPLAVLKLKDAGIGAIGLGVATVLTACGIETIGYKMIIYCRVKYGCNSAYRLRYWNISCYISRTS